MIICLNCGFNDGSNAKYCSKCRTPLRQETIDQFVFGEANEDKNTKTVDGGSSQTHL